MTDVTLVSSAPGTPQPVDGSTQSTESSTVSIPEEILADMQQKASAGNDGLPNTKYSQSLLKSEA